MARCACPPPTRPRGHWATWTSTSQYRVRDQSQRPEATAGPVGTWRSVRKQALLLSRSADWRLACTPTPAGHGRHDLLLGDCLPAPAVWRSGPSRKRAPPRRRPHVVLLPGAKDRLRFRLPHAEITIVWADRAPASRRPTPTSRTTARLEAEGTRGGVDEPVGGLHPGVTRDATASSSSSTASRVIRRGHHRP